MKFSILNHQFATATVPASDTVKIYLYNNGEQAHEVLVLRCGFGAMARLQQPSCHLNRAR